MNRRTTRTYVCLILEMDVDSIRAKYPHWTDEMVLDLKAQFQSFDLNLDGLIDFNELYVNSFLIFQ